MCSSPFIASSWPGHWSLVSGSSRNENEIASATHAAVQQLHLRQSSALSNCGSAVQIRECKIISKDTRKKKFPASSFRMRCRGHAAWQAPHPMHALLSISTVNAFLPIPSGLRRCPRRQFNSLLLFLAYFISTSQTGLPNTAAWSGSCVPKIPGTHSFGSPPPLMSPSPFGKL